MRNLPLHISPCLFLVDVRDTVPHRHHLLLAVGCQHQMLGVLARIMNIVHVAVKLGIQIGRHVFLTFGLTETSRTCNYTVALMVVETDGGTTAETHGMLAFAIECHTYDAALLGWSKFKGHAVQLGTIVIRMRLLVVDDAWSRPYTFRIIGGERHKAEHPVPAVVRHLQGEVLNPVVQHTAAQGNEPQHLVGKMHGLPGGFQQNTYPADGRVGIISHRLFRVCPKR